MLGYLIWTHQLEERGVNVVVQVDFRATLMQDVPNLWHNHRAGSLKEAA